MSENDFDLLGPILGSQINPFTVFLMLNNHDLMFVTRMRRKDHTFIKLVYTATGNRVLTIFPPTEPLWAIANYCSLPSFSFGHTLGKLQGKVLAHSEKVGWWKTLMVECVSIF